MARSIGRFHIDELAAAHQPSVSFLNVNGEVDVSTSGELDAAITAASHRQEQTIVVSFANCSSADVSCLRVLIGQFAKLAERLFIVAPSPGPMRRILDVTGLVKSLPVYASMFDVYSLHPSLR